MMRDDQYPRAPHWALKAHTMAANCIAIFGLAMAAFVAFIGFMQFRAGLDRKSLAIWVMVALGSLLFAWLAFLLGRYSDKRSKDRRP